MRRPLMNYRQIHEIVCCKRRGHKFDADYELNCVRKGDNQENKLTRQFLLASFCSSPFATSTLVWVLSVHSPQLKTSLREVISESENICDSAASNSWEETHYCHLLPLSLLHLDISTEWKVHIQFLINFLKLHEVCAVLASFSGW